MKQYQEQKDWLQDAAPVTGYTIDNMTIPTDPRNRDYAQMMAEVAAGEAEILPAVVPKAPE